MLSLLLGFTFTTIVLLLNQLPDPTIHTAQLMLLFLTVMFDLFLFLSSWQLQITIGLWDFHRAPPRARWECTAFNLILGVAIFIWGMSLSLIYLLWNLPYLAIIAGVMWLSLAYVVTVIGDRMGKRLGWSVMQEIRDMKREGFAA